MLKTGIQEDVRWNTFEFLLPELPKDLLFQLFNNTIRSVCPNRNLQSQLIHRFLSQAETIDSELKISFLQTFLVHLLALSKKEADYQLALETLDFDESLVKCVNHFKIARLYSIILKESMGPYCLEFVIQTLAAFDYRISVLPFECPNWFKLLMDPKLSNDTFLLILETLAQCTVHSLPVTIEMAVNIADSISKLEFESVTSWENATVKCVMALQKCLTNRGNKNLSNRQSIVKKTWNPFYKLYFQDVGLKAWKN